MEILLSSVVLFFFLVPAGACQHDCSAGDQEVRFPFYIANGPSTDRCGFPGFDLTCKNSQLVLNLPSAGDFIVQSIDYGDQRIQIQDPDRCIPKRLLNFSLSGSPFRSPRETEFKLLNCSMANTTEPPMVPGTCVNETQYAIIAIAVDHMRHLKDYEKFGNSCSEIKTVEASRTVHLGFLELRWDKPDCGSCERDGGTCRFKESTGSKIACYKGSSPGLPRSAKYGLIVGIGIPAFLCLIGLSCFTCGRIRTYARRRRLTDADFTVSIGPQPAVAVMGLDGPTIESYPKTVLGESRRLPKPNDGTCPICLSEYQPKDTIRTIPECNHCFHVDCVDEWLRMNATCPVCRNSPERSSVGTPCSSASSSTILSSSASSASLP